jgi:hypothetical protein
MLLKLVSIWPNFRDVTAERLGTVIGIVGATAAQKAKPQ